MSTVLSVARRRNGGTLMWRGDYIALDWLMPPPAVEYTDQTPQTAGGPGKEPYILIRIPDPKPKIRPAPEKRHEPKRERRRSWWPTVLFGGELAAIGGMGVEVTGGFMVGPNGCGGPAAGVFGSTGAGSGAHVGADVFAGGILGSVEDLSGSAGTINVSIGVVNFSLMASSSGSIGVTVGIGPGKGGSGVVSETKIRALNRCR